MSEASTTLLYAGEWSDGDRRQHLRARYYDQGVGRFSTLDPFAGDSQDPQSLHKYAYVHGDPVNGIDPTGMFLGGLGGIGIGLGRYSAAAQSAGVALGGLDRLMSAIEISQVALQVAVTGTADPMQVAEIAFDLLPGSGLVQRLRQAGGSVLAGLGVQRTLDGASELLNALHRNPAINDLGNIFQNVNGAATKAGTVANRYVERLGEIGGGLVASSLGFEAVDFGKKVHGFDGLFRKGDRFMIVEAKGGTGSLVGGQMSRKWIRDRIDKITDPGLRMQIQAQFDNDTLLAAVVETSFDGKGNLLDPSFIVKRMKDIHGPKF